MSGAILRFGCPPYIRFELRKWVRGVNPGFNESGDGDIWIHSIIVAVVRMTYFGMKLEFVGERDGFALV